MPLVPDAAMTTRIQRRRPMRSATSLPRIEAGTASRLTTAAIAAAGHGKPSPDVQAGREGEECHHPRARAEELQAMRHVAERVAGGCAVSRAPAATPRAETACATTARRRPAAAAAISSDTKSAGEQRPERAQR